MILLMMTIIPVGIMIFLKKSRAIQDRTSNQVYGQFKAHEHGILNYIIFHNTETITRNQSYNSSAIHTFNAMLPVSAEGTSDYECIDQGMLLIL